MTALAHQTISAEQTVPDYGQVPQYRRSNAFAK